MLGARESENDMCSKSSLKLQSLCFNKTSVGFDLSVSHWRPCQDCTKKAFHRRRAARNCEGQSGLVRLVDLLSVIWLWSTAVDSGLIATWSVLLVNTKDLFVWSTADIESLQIEIQEPRCVPWARKALKKFVVGWKLLCRLKARECWSLSEL